MKTLLMFVVVAGVSAGAAGLARTMQRVPGEPEYQPFRTVWSGVYSKPEAERGKETAARLCGSCHGAELKGGTAVRLTGPQFFERWDNLRLRDVVVQIQGTMPHGRDFFVPAGSTREVIAFMLRESGVPAGEERMPENLSVLGDILITRAPVK